MNYFKKSKPSTSNLFTIFCCTLLLAVFSNPSSVFGQNKDKVYSVADKMPELKGGLSSLYKKIKYPKKAQQQGISGRVYIQFIVDENGKVHKPKVLKGIGGGCDKAAVTAIKKVAFKPGQKNNKPVKVKFTLPVTFRIQDKK